MLFMPKALKNNGLSKIYFQMTRTNLHLGQAILMVHIFFSIEMISTNITEVLVKAKDTMTTTL